MGGRCKAGLTAILVAGACSAEAPAVEHGGRDPLGTIAAREPVPTPLTGWDDVEEVVRRSLRNTDLILARDVEGEGHLFLARPGTPPEPIVCADRLHGAWGLWVDDVDGDGNAEAIVALRKEAHFDPVVENRLHVYGFEQGRCVPAWRGTRLVGRFDALTTDPDRPGTLLVRERVASRRQRIARYAWTGFGYAVTAVLWEGEGDPPALDSTLETIAHRSSK